MATSKPRTKSTSRQQRDLVGRLADAGEEALQRLAELPGGKTALNAVNDLRSRVDDLGKRVRGIEDLEARVAKLERDLSALRKAKAPSRRRATTRKPPT
jgi:outer membrane murein-binding lipoprotein Lpp